MNQEGLTATAEQIVEALENVKRTLGITEPAMVGGFWLHCENLADVLRLNAARWHDSVLQSGNQAVFMRCAYGFQPVYWAMDLDVVVTPENVDLLPTEALRQQARKLLGLPEPAPEYTTGVVELGVQG